MKVKILPEETKQQIAKLVERKFIEATLKERLPEYYPDFECLKKLTLDPYKRHLGVTSAVFVVEYKIEYLNKKGENKLLDLFASAHSDGSRQAAYKKTTFLYQYGFNQGQYKVTRPLFFLPEQEAFFYEASIGRSLFNFFTQSPEEDLRPAFSLVVGWMKKLHNFNPRDFDWPVFRISTMIPLPEKFIKDFYNDNQQQGQIVDELFQQMQKDENRFNKTIKKTLIYGDNHPENIIIRDLKADYLEMIDFTDVALGDPMIDLGTFLQQFDFMGHNFISREKMNDYKTFFVENYFQQSFSQIKIDYLNRINLYQSWTALRSATFLFYMKDVENPILDLLHDSQNYLQLAKQGQRIINLH
ncbi:MAG: hypothetical protein COV55_03780 [Candidatus Komeilibacteria bacterium CG11_big_fil_rev_8_21_14_0_20_36_20]|uniref:Aminoglycoside phosphotransferase domain-containing protein n=1 Tax=Candidatus Komeilibacteria bacterium CG11_big_fil_rev_8_21_14_0_20_36_20 TaxID=1974477 RepID=A0A2H0NCK9_9BACT|nr:MAG: hypothetical protein COV55_03780 [Candidatus Komeilibacteria bacterium CG11_big_fil_rev_8_21_14_0_20_36_20]PIR81950.1 MAG: hypothetical protein COU21_01225 [Candidatus Komeilibacteria bacterium CG10_big_fil_rev_8_21_14_0_10_36_65]PJC55482.1 MAG: hypothetical protein CO027_01905 [Candidatus Komeilibacteria bacterium CG_4_9_14_0_2_um_filter_36_13]